MSAPVPSAQPTTTRGTAARIASAAALAAAGAAIVLIVLGVVGVASTATPNMQGFNPGATLTVSSSGASVYARSDSDRTQTVCRAADDGESITLERPTREFAVDVSGSDFFEVARTPQSLGPGSYELSCEGTTQSLYVGPAAPSTSASGLLGPVGLVAGVVVALLALALGVLALLLGRSRPSTAHAASSASPASPAHAASSHSPMSAPQGNPHPEQAPYGQGTYSHDPYRPDADDSSAYTQPMPQQSPALPPPPGWGTPDPARRPDDDQDPPPGDSGQSYPP
ncbi:MAG: hypothetical protein WA962_14860, partial [Ornithinimicrobium sp.]